MSYSEQRDIAGEAYWSKEWRSSFDRHACDERLNGWQNHPVVQFDRLLARYIHPRADGTPLVVLEVGCARSRWLPYFARRFGARVRGLDYSEIGCQQAREVLRAAGQTGEIFHGDLFTPPATLLQGADVVFSWGLVEHFTATTSVALALHQLVRPGGKVITVIPNMLGAPGRLQRWLSRAVFDLHVPLDRERLRAGISAVPATVEHCDYLLPANFWVVNPGSNVGAQISRTKRLVHSAAKLLTLAAWQVERSLGKSLPTSSLLSPYIVCISSPAAG